jgi:hypothetical protein
LERLGAGFTLVLLTVLLTDRLGPRLVPLLLRALRVLLLILYGARLVPLLLRAFLGAPLIL